MNNQFSHHLIMFLKKSVSLHVSFIIFILFFLQIYLHWGNFQYWWSFMMKQNLLFLSISCWLSLILLQYQNFKSYIVLVQFNHKVMFVFVHKMQFIMQYNYNFIAISHKHFHTNLILFLNNTWRKSQEKCNQQMIWKRIIKK